MNKSKFQPILFRINRNLFSEMIKYLFIIFFGFGLNLSALADDIEIDVRYLDHESLLDYNFNSNMFSTNQQVINDSLRSFFVDWDIEQNIKIIQTVPPVKRGQILPGSFHLYQFTAKPALTDSTEEALQKMLMSISPITSLYLHFSTEYSITLNGGCGDRGLDYAPILENQFEVEKRSYENGDLKQNFDLIQNWVRLGAFPVMVQILNEKPEELKSIFGAFELKAENIIYHLEERKFFSPVLLELYPKNPQLIPALKVMLLVVEGRFAYAETYKQMIYQFEEEGTLLRYLLDELTWRMGYYFEVESELVKSALIPKENGNDKVALLDSILAINKNSAVALYHSIDQSIPPLLSTYPDRELIIQLYESNPMFSGILKPYSKKKAYHNHLRKLTHDLFIDAETFDEGFPIYAEIALELGAYEFAGDLYWMLLYKEFNNMEGLQPPKHIIDEYQFRYDYSVYKFRQKTSFEKSLVKKFKRLDKKFRKRMKKHPTYKNFNP